MDDAQARPEELLTGARDGDLLATDDDDLLAAKQLLRNDGRKAPKKVATPIDDNRRLEHDGSNPCPRITCVELPPHHEPST